MSKSDGGDDKVEGVYLTKSLCMNQIRQGGIIGIKGSLIGRRIELQNNAEIVIGRDAEQVDLVINGSKVSRIHCSIRFNFHRNDYTICDYSTNGTYIGKEELLLHKDKKRVPPGTILKLGNDENVLQLY